MAEDNNSNNPPIYILMISIHGLMRGNDLELGRDADTGGQTKYVVELARALANHPRVDKVDVLTRLVQDPAVHADYAIPEEPLADKARIIRLSCGPKKYIRKELLWPYLDQMVDKTLSFIREQRRLPDLIHSHYADAGYVGKQLSMLLGVPLIHTGHSLGHPKKSRLLASGRKAHAIEQQFNFEQRIAVEQDVLQHASLIITSTRQEIEEQYGMYQRHDTQQYSVIPPGIDASRFSPPGRRKIHPVLKHKVDRFLSEPEKPIILSICRPALRKNLRGLMTAYGQSAQLQAAANLVIVAGEREDIRKLDSYQRTVMRELLLDLDKYDLWGKVALPKQIMQEEIPELYRLAAKRQGLFVNPAFTEPFGLTLIEAAASGLPFVAPDDGGPRDIVANCRNGLLTNTLDSAAIADTVQLMLADKRQLKKWARNGMVQVNNHYSWDAHVSKYIKVISRILQRNNKRNRRALAKRAMDGKLPIPLVNKMIISDIDNTLIGDAPKLQALLEWLRQHADSVGFGLATGRTIDSAVATLKKHRISLPDVLITSVGSEIHYGPDLVQDTGWTNHIRHLWRREDIQHTLAAMKGLTLQPRENQREFKLSYYVNPKTMPPVTDINQLLLDHHLHAQLIYSHEKFLDILPVRASKGHAIRYLAYKWGLPLKHFLVAGDSGNDIDMLIGDTLAVVVGNHSPEMESLHGLDQLYFAHNHYAAGILEGLAHYEFAGFERREHNTEEQAYV